MINDFRSAASELDASDGDSVGTSVDCGVNDNVDENIFDELNGIVCVNGNDFDNGNVDVKS